MGCSSGCCCRDSVVTVSSNAQALCRSLLEFSPSQRLPSARSALNHPWFKHAVDTVPFSPFYKAKLVTQPIAHGERQRQLAFPHLSPRYFQLEGSNEEHRSRSGQSPSLTPFDGKDLQRLRCSLCASSRQVCHASSTGSPKQQEPAHCGCRSREASKLLFSMAENSNRCEGKKNRGFESPPISKVRHRVYARVLHAIC